MEETVGSLNGAPRFSVIYEVIKKKIIYGELTSNTPLTEESLAEEFNVSRTPIREALRKLEQDGLVEMIPRRGAYIKGITLIDIEEIFSVREGLEGLCTNIATILISDQNLNYLETVLKEADEAFQKGILKKGDELHDVILRIAGNSRILNIVSNLKDHIQRLHNLSLTIPGRLELSNKQHWEIFHAIQQRDPELAEKKMRDHIRSTKQSIIIAVKNDINGL